MQACPKIIQTLLMCTRHACHKNKYSNYFKVKETETVSFQSYKNTLLFYYITFIQKVIRSSSHFLFECLFISLLLLIINSENVDRHVYSFNNKEFFFPCLHVSSMTL